MNLVRRFRNWLLRPLHNYIEKVAWEIIDQYDEEVAEVEFEKKASCRDD